MARYFHRLFLKHATLNEDIYDWANSWNQSLKERTDKEVTFWNGREEYVVPYTEKYENGKYFLEIIVNTKNNEIRQVEFYLPDNVDERNRLLSPKEERFEEYKKLKSMNWDSDGYYFGIGYMFNLCLYNHKNHYVLTVDNLSQGFIPNYPKTKTEWIKMFMKWEGTNISDVYSYVREKYGKDVHAKFIKSS